jgi:glutamate-ammonia-ligase adenylyltransferase
MSLNFSNASLPPIANAERARIGIERWLETAARNKNKTLADFMLHVCQADHHTGTHLRSLLESTFGGSPFLTLCACKVPSVVKMCAEHGFDKAYAQIMSDTWAAVEAETDRKAAMKYLRDAKTSLALLIALADIAGAWPVMAVTKALSDFAQSAVRLSLRFLLREQVRKNEITLPDLKNPENGCGIFILGMGKFGAKELNYSSDIDLIVFFDPDAVTYTGRKTLRECFIRVTRDLVKFMDERTGDGYVFRTDLRLRPDPGSTPVAISIEAAEHYYESFGQNWERAAMIKGRVIAGDQNAGDMFTRFIQPFIWRKSLDLNAINDIHSIKRQIYAQKGGRVVTMRGHNIKLGRGGIREIEFFAQTQQLIWGGRDPRLRSCETLETLKTLHALDLISEAALTELTAAYLYLRQLEHRLQMINDQQTQTLPETDEALTELALFMGHATLHDFETTLLRHLTLVENHYAELFEESPALSTNGNLVFTGHDDDPETLKTLRDYGFAKPEVVAECVRGWHMGRPRGVRTARAREVLTELTPSLLQAFGGTAQPDTAFLRFDKMLQHLPSGMQLFTLFQTNPSLMNLVADVMGDSPRLSEMLSRKPALLDMVLTPGFFDPLPENCDLEKHLSLILQSATYYEDVLNLVRRWANDHRFQIGVQTLQGAISAVEASVAFSRIASIVLSTISPYVEAEFQKSHGTLPGADMCLLAYGKLGSYEMTPTSDLDMVIIYTTPPDIKQSDGKRPLSPPEYYKRLVQRYINAISAPTNEGTLYEVDMRLRPSGNAGPIATSLDAFKKYQTESAWTWEHQALTRARVITSCIHAPKTDLAQHIETFIGSVLQRPRNIETLKQDVYDMRIRMATEHKTDNIWALKHVRGGLIDVEFIAQYLQLAHAHTHPTIRDTRTSHVFINAGKLGILSPEDAEFLHTTHRIWLTLVSIMRHTTEGTFNPDKATSEQIKKLVTACQAPNFEHLKLDIEDRQTQVKALFETFIKP